MKNEKDKAYWSNTLFNTIPPGLRGRREYSLEKPKGTVRIAVLGTPTRPAKRSARTKTYSYRFGKVFPMTEVPKFGVFWLWFTIKMLDHFWRDEVLEYHPDIVLVDF